MAQSRSKETSMDQIQDHCILFFILAFFCSMYSLCATFYENYYFICLPKYVRKVDMHLTSFLLMHAEVFNNIIFSFFYINSWINYELMTYEPWLLFFYLLTESLTHTEVWLNEANHGQRNKWNLEAYSYYWFFGVILKYICMRLIQK